MGAGMDPVTRREMVRDSQWLTTEVNGETILGRTKYLPRLDKEREAVDGYNYSMTKWAMWERVWQAD